MLAASIHHHQQHRSVCRNTRSGPGSASEGNVRSNSFLPDTDVDLPFFQQERTRSDDQPGFIGQTAAQCLVNRHPVTLFYTRQRVSIYTVTGQYNGIAVQGHIAFD